MAVYTRDANGKLVELQKDVSRTEVVQEIVERVGSESSCIKDVLSQANTLSAIKKQVKKAEEAIDEISIQ